MEMSSRHSRLKFHDAASVLKNKFKESGRPASVEEIANVLQSEVEAPPKTKAHYRREVTKRLGFNPVIRPNKMISAMGRATVVSLHLASSASGVATGKSTKTKEVSISIDKGAGKQFSAMLGGDDAERSAAGVIKWTKDKDQVSESDGVIECIVERVGGSKGEVSVQYHTKDQTAMGGKDYETVTGELTWADGDAEPKTITIKIIDDDTYEKDEEFTVVLTEPKGGATFPQMTDGGAEEEIMTVTILNDDERAMALRQALMMINIDFDSLDLASSDWASQVVPTLLTAPLSDPPPSDHPPSDPSPLRLPSALRPSPPQSSGPPITSFHNSHNPTLAQPPSPTPSTWDLYGLAIRPLLTLRLVPLSHA